jgi:hypothetical protein
MKIGKRVVLRLRNANRSVDAGGCLDITAIYSVTEEGYNNIAMVQNV